MAIEGFPEPVSAVARAIATVLAGSLSALRIFSIRLRYPRVSIGRGCSALPGTRVRASDGGRIELGNDVDLGRGVDITCKYGEIEIGNHSFLGQGCVIVARDSIRIGHDALIGEGVSIRDQDHGSALNWVPFRLQQFSCAPVVIGDNVWLGAKSSILRGVTIGDNAIVAAHAVVNTDVPPGTVVAGVPAKVVKTAEERLNDPER